MTESELEIFDSPIDVINWINKISNLEFFKNVAIIPFGDMAVIHPKEMDKEHSIKKLKQYWRVHAEYR